MNKFIAEGIGTFALVFFAIGTVCWTALAIGTPVAWIAVSFAFGLAVIAMAYGIGPISGAHLNPAVSFGLFMAGRINSGTMIGYWIAQFIGALAGTVVLGYLMGGMEGVVAAANTVQEGSTVMNALVFEIVATFLFLVVILGATQNGAPTSVAGLAIGLTLTVIHLVGIGIDNTSVNPARTLATNIFGGGQAMAELWIFFVGPLVGAGIAGILYKGGLTRASDDI